MRGVVASTGTEARSRSRMPGDRTRHAPVRARKTAGRKPTPQYIENGAIRSTARAGGETPGRLEARPPRVETRQPSRKELSPVKKPTRASSIAVLALGAAFAAPLGASAASDHRTFDGTVVHVSRENIKVQGVEGGQDADSELPDRPRYQDRTHGQTERIRPHYVRSETLGSPPCRLGRPRGQPGAQDQILGFLHKCEFTPGLGRAFFVPRGQLCGGLHRLDDPRDRRAKVPIFKV